MAAADITTAVAPRAADTAVAPTVDSVGAVLAFAATDAAFFPPSLRPASAVPCPPPCGLRLIVRAWVPPVSFSSWSSSNQARTSPRPSNLTPDNVDNARLSTDKPSGRPFFRFVYFLSVLFKLHHQSFRSSDVVPNRLFYPVRIICSNSLWILPWAMPLPSLSIMLDNNSMLLMTI